MISQQPNQVKRYDPQDTTLEFVTRPDEIVGDDDPDTLRAEMSCGHAVTPESLTNWCQHLLSEGQYKFTCPALQEEEMQKCGAEWSYQEVRKMAMLTDAERRHFEETMARHAAARYCEYKSCPGCHSFVVREDFSNLRVHCTICSAETGRAYEFCWQCEKRWRGPQTRSDRCDNDGCVNTNLQVLQRCTMVSLPQVQGVTACPSVRACPTCGKLVGHDQTGCKNIICPRCRVEFCFLCLKLTSECLENSSYFTPCADGVAPRQTSVPSWNRNTALSGPSAQSITSGQDNSDRSWRTTQQLSEDKRYDPRDSSLIFVSRPDDITRDDDPDTLRAEMSCGHAVTPESLTNWCQHLLSEGQYKFTCPALQEGRMQKCGAEWSYQEVRKMAMLTDAERRHFEETMARHAAASYCEYKSCPGCHSFVVREDFSNLSVRCTICTMEMGRVYEFCWQCLKEWTGPGPGFDRCANKSCANRDLELLKTCLTISLPQVRGVTACPSVRACPTCGQLAEHDQTGCKNILCSRCQVEFCFLCLKLTSECLKNSSYFIPCADGVAPRQTSIPSWNRN